MKNQESAINPYIRADEESSDKVNDEGETEKSLHVKELGGEDPTSKQGPSKKPLTKKNV